MLIPGSEALRLACARCGHPELLAEEEFRYASRSSSDSGSRENRALLSLFRMAGPEGLTVAEACFLMESSGFCSELEQVRIMVLVNLVADRLELLAS